VDKLLSNNDVNAPCSIHIIGFCEIQGVQVLAPFVICSSIKASKEALLSVISLIKHTFVTVEAGVQAASESVERFIERISWSVQIVLLELVNEILNVPRNRHFIRQGRQPLLLDKRDQVQFSLHTIEAFIVDFTDVPTLFAEGGLAFATASEVGQPVVGVVGAVHFMRPQSPV